VLGAGVACQPFQRLSASYKPLNPDISQWNEESGGFVV
jgi:hypothetical protein